MPTAPSDTQPRHRDLFLDLRVASRGGQTRLPASTRSDILDHHDGIIDQQTIASPCRTWSVYCRIAEKGLQIPNVTSQHHRTPMGDEVARMLCRNSSIPEPGRWLRNNVFTNLFDRGAYEGVVRKDRPLSGVRETPPAQLVDGTCTLSRYPVRWRRSQMHGNARGGLAV